MGFADIVMPVIYRNDVASLLRMRHLSLHILASCSQTYVTADQI